VLVLNVSIWELNCHKREGNHWKDKGVEITVLGKIDFFDFWYQCRQVITNLSGKFVAEYCLFIYFIPYFNNSLFSS